MGWGWAWFPQTNSGPLGPLKPTAVNSRDWGGSVPSGQQRMGNSSRQLVLGFPWAYNSHQWSRGRKGEIRGVSRQQRVPEAA